MLYNDLLKETYNKGKKNCYWLPREIYKRLGINLPEYDEPDEASTISKMINEGKDFAEELKEPEPFCFVLFSLRHPYINHIGVVLEDCKSFIHMLKGRNVAIEKLDHEFWKKHFKGYYKWIGK